MEQQYMIKVKATKLNLYNALQVFMNKIKKTSNQNKEI